MSQQIKYTIPSTITSDSHAIGSWNEAGKQDYKTCPYSLVIFPCPDSHWSNYMKMHKHWDTFLSHCMMVRGRLSSGRWPPSCVWTRLMCSQSNKQNTANCHSTYKPVARLWKPTPIFQQERMPLWLLQARNCIISPTCSKVCDEKNTCHFTHFRNRNDPDCSKQRVHMSTRYIVREAMKQNHAPYISGSGMLMASLTRSHE
jgi:hypothetical protein